MSQFSRPSHFTERGMRPLKDIRDLEADKQKKKISFADDKARPPADPPGVITRSMRDRPFFQPIYTDSTQKEEYIKKRKRPAEEGKNEGTNHSSPLIHHNKTQFEGTPVQQQDDMIAQKKQHFQYGKVADGKKDNKLIYGQDPILVRDPVPGKRKIIRPPPTTILYGDNDTNVGYATQGTGRMAKRWLEPTSADVHRKNREIEETEDFISMHKREVKEKRVKEADAKKKDYDMLTTYSPWGKPGAGAPNPVNSPRQREFLQNLNPITNIEYQAHKSREERNIKKWYDDGSDTVALSLKFGGGVGGGGAPRLDKSGNIVTHINQTLQATGDNTAGLTTAHTANDDESQARQFPHFHTATTYRPFIAAQQRQTSHFERPQHHESRSDGSILAQRQKQTKLGLGNQPDGKTHNQHQLQCPAPQQPQQLNQNARAVFATVPSLPQPNLANANSGGRVAPFQNQPASSSVADEGGAEANALIDEESMAHWNANYSTLAPRLFPADPQRELRDRSGKNITNALPTAFEGFPIRHEPMGQAARNKRRSFFASAASNGLFEGSGNPEVDVNVNDTSIPRKRFAAAAALNVSTNIVFNDNAPEDNSNRPLMRPMNPAAASRAQQQMSSVFACDSNSPRASTTRRARRHFQQHGRAATVSAIRSDVCGIAERATRIRQAIDDVAAIDNVAEGAAAAVSPHSAQAE